MRAGVATKDAAPGLMAWEVVFGVALAGTSGAAVLAHTFGPVPMSFTAPFVVLPATALLVGLALLRRGRYARLHLFSRLLLGGAAWGLAATLAYDVIRPGLMWALTLSFNPYRAMPIFGHLITGLPADHRVAVAVGWAYHFWNGISFGMMFALVRPRGGAFAGLVWGLALQALMMLAYPKLLEIRLADPGFLTAGLVGHGLWGVILGAGIRRSAGFYRGGPHA
jgi:hypothetical protein